jgi:hypothetical protein
LWTFQIASTGCAHDFSNAIDLLMTFRPESDASLIGDVVRVLVESKKLHWLAVVFSFEASPFFTAFVAFESEDGKDSRIKFLRSRPIAHAQIDVIKNADTHSMKCVALLVGPLLGGAPGPVPGLAELSAGVIVDIDAGSCIAQPARMSATVIKRIGSIRIESAL